MNFVGEDFIKRSKIRYMKCQEGDLHQGELLTAVCVDPSCTRRGLICPVCRNQQHEEHKVISLKTFLQEASNRFSKHTNEHELTSLSDYLRQLDQTKKQLVVELNLIVTQLADKIRTIEVKMNDNYQLLRKMTLAESTISIKLPRLIEMMIDPAAHQDDQHIFEEFQKYALLASYEEGVISFEDNAKKILEQYSEFPSLLKEAVSKTVPDVLKKLDELPFVMDTNSVGKPGEQVKYTFSKDNKHNDIQLESNKKATVPEIGNKNDDDEDVSMGGGGIVLVSEGIGLKHQSISLKVISNSSSSLIVGLSLPDIVKNHEFRMSEDEGHGIFGVSSNGYTVIHNNPDQEDSTRAFQFFNGDIVHIESDSKTRKITFTKKNSTQKYVMDVPEAFDLTKMKIAVALYENDAVEIVAE